MKHHTITLKGGPSDLRIPADILVELVSALQEGAQRAARFIAEGESIRKGPKPAWLDAVSRFDVTGLKQGSTVLQIEAPSLAEAVPDRFADVKLAIYSDPTRTVDTNQSAIDFFGNVLSSTLFDNRETVLADRALLESCARLARVPSRGFESIVLGGVAGVTEPITLSVTDADKIERLRNETPAPRALRITGTLDTISMSKTDVLIRMKDGSSVTARVENHDPESLRSLFAKQVIVAGMAQFRPSSRLLFIDAEYIGEATEKDPLWDKIPTPHPIKSMPVANLRMQDDNTGTSAFFGTWPGDESDEELLAALTEIR